MKLGLFGLAGTTWLERLGDNGLAGTGTEFQMS